ncbi:peptidase S8/S53 domain-containing protein [Cladochytrium replicatum]|nr:peptidase S8/S53 domain-containing protein [Cladochytrium replicatum]
MVLALAYVLLLAGAGLSSAARISPLLKQKADELSASRITAEPIISFLVQLNPPAVPVAHRLTRRELLTEAEHAAHGEELHRLLRRDAQILGAPVRNALASTETRSKVKFVKQYEISNTFVVDAPYSVVEQLAKLPEVESITPNFDFKVNLPKPEITTAKERRQTTTFQWNIQNVNATAAYNRGFTGGGLRYANADSGVQWDHPFLKSIYAGTQPNGAVNHNYAWFDGVRRNIDGGTSSRCPFAGTTPCDDNGHGTHTMSSAVGLQGVGVAFGARWMACRNMNAGNGRPEYYLNCLNWILAPTDVNGNNANATLRPHAVGNSYGCPSEELCNASTFDTALANLNTAGVFMSVSAGNSGPSCSTITDPPANEGNTIVVAALTQANALASYSSRGPVTGKSKGVDLAAPGSSVRGAYPNNSTMSLSGTSMASPHVGGAAILIAQACPKLQRDVTKIKTLLFNTAKPLFATNGCGGDTSTTRPNNSFGYGLINIGAAIASCTAA